MATESNSFEIILKALMDDFGGPEIFCEENEPRLTKALKAIEGLFAKEKKQLLMACMENVPQTMYSAVGLPPKEQQAQVDVCLEKLNELGVAKEVAEAILLGFINALKLNAKATKMPEFEKIMGEMEIDGEIYKTCQIGKQIWMAENLRVSVSRWCRGESVGIAVPGYKYGRLYTRKDAEDYNKDGWRLPSIEDWLEMVRYIESLGFDAGTALKSVGDWGGKADPGLDLFGFAAHPLKFWDDNYPEKHKIKKSRKDSFMADLDCMLEIANRYLDMSTVSQFPCVQFWASTNYVDFSVELQSVTGGAECMAYVATLGDFNKIELENGKLSGRSSLSQNQPLGFACVRYVRDVENKPKKKK